MDTEKEMWHPILKINDSVVVMAKYGFRNTVYALLYKHTFSFVTPHKLLESEIFNINCQNIENLHTTAEKLRYYRHKKSLLQKDVAKFTGLSESTYINYENINRNYYPLEVLRKIADLYEIDFKILLDDYNLFLCNDQGNQIKKLRKEFGLTQKELANKLNINRRTVGGWEKNKIRISNEIYERLKNNFQNFFLK